MRRAVSLQSKAWHVFAAGPPNCKSDNEFWENRLTRFYLFYVANPNDNIRIDALIYELRILNFP